MPGTKTEDPTGTGALPGYNTKPDVCLGLVYADDILAFEETNEKAQKFLENLERWMKEWDAEIGIKKCEVMCWLGKEETHQTHQQTTYKAGNSEMPKVDQYKYLGIWVDWNPPEDNIMQSVIYTKRYLRQEKRGEFLSLVRIPQG